MSANWEKGNAVDDGCANRGWLVGHFVDPADSIRCSRNVEVKWGVHPAGQQRPEWTRDDQRTALVVLVSGNFRIQLSGGMVDLGRVGDYVMWGPGIDHSWVALADSVVITIRWPSSP